MKLKFFRRPTGLIIFLFLIFSLSPASLYSGEKKKTVIEKLFKKKTKFDNSKSEVTSVRGLDEKGGNITKGSNPNVVSVSITKEELKKFLEDGGLKWEKVK